MMKVMNNKQFVALMIGLLFLAACALFPPRRFSGSTISINKSTVPPRAFLYHQRLHRLGSDEGGDLGKVEIDMGKALAEFVLVVSLTGVALAYYRR